MSTPTINTTLKLFKSRTGKSVARIALESDLNQDNLYKWIKGTRISDPEDYKKLERYLESQGAYSLEFEANILEDSPTLLLDSGGEIDQYGREKVKNLSGRNSENHVVETPNSVSLSRLDKLIDSNQMLAKANLDLSENTVRLTKMSSFHVSSKKFPIFQPNRTAFQEGLATLMWKGGIFHTYQEAVLKLDKILDDFEREAIKEDKNVALDKSNKK